jgi:hypothetical protein
MILNVLFDYATIYNFESIDVAIGQKFKVVTVDDIGSDIDWFSNSDQCLEITANGKEATFVALTEGVSTIKFIRGNSVLHSFTITVVNPVLLNPSLAAIEMK